MRNVIYYALIVVAFVVGLSVGARLTKNPKVVINNNVADSSLSDWQVMKLAIVKTESEFNPLAEKLKEKGMPIEYDMNWIEEVFKTNKIKLVCPTYAEVFDWLMDKGVHFRIESDWDTETQIVTKLACGFHIERVGMRPIYVDCPTWHEAAEAAIEKALTLI